MKFSKKLIAIIIIVILLVSSLIILILYYPLFNPKKIVEKIFNSSTKLTNNGKKIEGGLEEYSKIFNKTEILVTKYDPLSPVVSVAFNFKSNEQTTDVWVLKLKRSGLDNYDLDQKVSTQITNKTFPQALELATKYDLSQTNPDPQNITVYTPPTQQEIDETKKQTEVYSNPEFRKLEDYCRSEYLAQGKNEEYTRCSNSARSQFGLGPR